MNILCYHCTNVLHAIGAKNSPKYCQIKPEIYMVASHVIPLSKKPYTIYMCCIYCSNALIKDENIIPNTYKYYFHVCI